MKTIETKVFEYSELDDHAKQRAREWWLNGAEIDLDSTLDYATEVAGALGINLRTKDIHYEVGYGQGSGASFSGTYEYSRDACERIREVAPCDSDLHLMAEQLRCTQDKRQNDPITASIYGSGRYYNLKVSTDEKHEHALEDLESIFADFAHWIYSRLQAELEYQTSEEVVEENIIANEYTFTETGQRWG